MPWEEHGKTRVWSFSVQHYSKEKTGTVQMPITREWPRKSGCTYAMDYFAAVKKNEEYFFGLVRSNSKVQR